MNLKENIFSYIDGKEFFISEYGILFNPILDFSLYRDKDLSIKLKTKLNAYSRPKHEQEADGITRLNKYTANFSNEYGDNASIFGIQSYGVTRISDDNEISSRCETVRIHSVDLSINNKTFCRYGIDWIYNLPLGFIWPNILYNFRSENEYCGIEFEDGNVKILSSKENYSCSKAVATFSVKNVNVYLCLLKELENDENQKYRPGCIIYDGIMDLETRKKIRVSLSLALGVFLVDLGHTNYDNMWNALSMFARTAYSLNDYAFRMNPKPFSPLNSRNEDIFNSQYLNIIDEETLGIIVNSFVDNYDILDLNNLSWAYWHACASTPHMAPAHFGAAIESLQTAYLKKYPHNVSRERIPDDAWQPIKDELTFVVNKSEVDDHVKLQITQQIGNLNQIGQRLLLKEFFNL